MKCFLLAFFSLATAVAVADTMDVTVSCSNGALVPNLPVTVYDATGVKVPDTTETDSSGVFQIQNSQTYTTPFIMFFTCRQGSTCGGYAVISSNTTQGNVFLNYYPTQLPCSCSKFVE